ncbi:hypothetical protein ING2D1G_1012 [Peptoniphilus sp. ING2-D1G]|nr:hypothetical protein ING2D1G_1012 [Peptoniphilus sp. ING2-D1G]
MKILYKIINTLTKSKSAYKRFPISMFLIILTAVFFILAVYSDTQYFSYDMLKGNDKNYLVWGFMFLFVTVSSIFMKLTFEAFRASAKDSEELSKYKYLGGFLLLLNLIIIYGVYNKLFIQDEILFSYDSKYVYWGMFLFLCVGCFYISKIVYHKDYVPYVMKILIAAAISISYSVVLYLGIIAIFTALTTLFDVEIAYEIYESAFIIVFLPFNVGILLSNYPRFRDSFQNYEVSKTFKTLISYIVIPIFTIYGIILYLYFGKILIVRELPRGIITNLVLWYGLLSVALLFLFTTIKDSPVIYLFKKYFPMTMLPVLSVMFISIFIRIGEYGITENRYFVLMAGIFTTLSMIYYIVYKNNSNIAIPILLSFIIFISTIGPLSAYNVSALSQSRRLKDVLERNEILNGTQIVANPNISEKDKRIIDETVKYLSLKHRAYESRYLPADFIYNDENFNKLFGFNPTYKDYASLESSSEVNDYYFDFNTEINTSGYDKLFVVNALYTPGSKTYGNYTINNNGNRIKIDYKDDKQEFNLITFTTKEIYDKMIALKKSKDILNIEDLAVKGIAENIRYKILFTSISGYPNENDEIECYVEFYLLVASEK